MTGLPQKQVVNKFSITAKRLREMGFIPINPIEVVNDWKTDWHTAMRLCIRELMTADAVYALPDADQSRGANIEMSICHKLNIPMFATLNGVLKHFGRFPQGKCLHPEERRKLQTRSDMNVDTAIEVCDDCEAVITSTQRLGR